MGNDPLSALRQQMPPPPPAHRCSEGPVMGDPHSNRVPAPTKSKEEGNRSRGRGRGRGRGIVWVRSRPYYFRRCKKVSSTNIGSLPNEVLFEILVRLSADEIYERARLVCRSWYHLIHTDAFVCAHLHRTSSGLLLAEFWCPPILLAATNKGGIEITKLTYHNRFSFSVSCNGLLVGVECVGKYGPYLVNPATKTPFSLPRFFDRSGLGYFGIAYAAASMEYKVVGTYEPYFNSSSSQCAILTVGVDNTWRHVVIDKLSRRANGLLLTTPKITQGFVHWVLGGPHVLTLNVETEIMTETPVPRLLPTLGCYYLSTGRYLTLLIYCKNYLWEVWEMKPESGEWRMLPHNIDLEAHKCKIQLEFAFDFISPIGWVKYPELLAFISCGNSHSCIIYNLDTDEIIDSIELPSPAWCYSVKPHKNSLVWLS